jgi:hypothetical protein
MSASSRVALWHATHQSNLDSIRANGLDPARSTGKRSAVWLHTSSCSAWALLHCAKRHGWSVEDLIIVQVSVPRAALRRSSSRGLWWTPALVPVTSTTVRTPGDIARPLA